MLPTSDREADASSAFLNYLREAAQPGKTTSRQRKPNVSPLRRNCIRSTTLRSHRSSRRCFEQHRHGDAIELAAIIAQLDPHRALPHFRVGYTLQMANRHGEAIAPYRRALAIDPTLPQLRSNLAGALMLTGGDLNEQLALLENAVRDEPLNGDGWTNLTNAYRMSLDLPRALEAGARAVQCAPRSPLTHSNYALALREAQRWAEAEQAATTAHMLAPHNATLRSNLAMLQLMRGDYATRLVVARSTLGWLA